MCEICGSMLAAEHTEQPGAELCPKCRRFPLDTEMPFDPSQWDYVAPNLEDASESGAQPEPGFFDSMPEETLQEPEEHVLGETDEEADEEPEDRARTCYHCYQAESGLAEICPVCGDSYLPPAMRKPHLA